MVRMWRQGLSLTGKAGLHIFYLYKLLNARFRILSGIIGIILY
jgi:hypothetical protein